MSRMSRRRFVILLVTVTILSVAVGLLTHHISPASPGSDVILDGGTHAEQPRIGHQVPPAREAAPGETLHPANTESNGDQDPFRAQVLVWALDRNSGLGVAGVTIDVLQAPASEIGSAEEGRQVDRWLTNTNGTAVGELSPGTYRLEFRHATHAALPRVLEVEAGQQSIQFSHWMFSSPVFEGLVLSSEGMKPVRLATVRLEGPGLEKVAHTTEAGRYMISVSDDPSQAFGANVKISARHNRFLDEPSCSIILASPRVRVPDLLFELRAGAIRGRVVDVSGLPCEIAVRLLRWPDGGGVRAQTSSADGEFHFSRLHPGAYSLDFPGSCVERPEPQAITVVEGSAVDVGDVRRFPGAVVTSGVVIDAQARPVGGVYIGSGAYRTSSKEDGSFALESCEHWQDVMTLRWSSGPGLHWRQSFGPISSGSRDVTIRLRETGLVLHLLERATGKPIVGQLEIRAADRHRSRSTVQRTPAGGPYVAVNVLDWEEWLPPVGGTVQVPGYRESSWEWTGSAEDLRAEKVVVTVEMSAQER